MSTADQRTKLSTNPEVLAAFVPDWQMLDSESSPTDEARAKQVAADAALREELGQVLAADNLVVLAGLGTSLGVSSSKTGAKAPRMTDLWADVQAVPSFEAATAKLTTELVDSENLEHVLSDAQARSALSPTDEDLSAFVREAEAIVWSSCNFVDSSSDLTTHELFLRKVARRSTRLQRTELFTTNYDLAFETAAARTRFNVIDGFGFGDQAFDGNLFDLDFVRRRPGEQMTLEPNVFHLLKLHGSVNWNNTGNAVTKVNGQPPKPVLIYPSAAKYQLSFQQPYLEFMSRFQIALRQSDVGLLVIGFGFNDYHLAAPIEAALRSNIGIRVAVVTPGARDTARSESISWIEQLIRLGDRRLTLINGTFADLVRKLPDVPATEERDAHADRVLRSQSWNSI